MKVDFPLIYRLFLEVVLLTGGAITSITSPEADSGLIETVSRMPYNRLNFLIMPYSKVG